MSESRPINCREALREAGKVYPRSGCSACLKGGLYGCPYEIKNLKEQSSETSIATNPTPQFKIKIRFINQAEEVVEIISSTLGGLAWALNQNHIHNSDKDASREIVSIDTEESIAIKFMLNQAQHELAELREWKAMLSTWGGSPDVVNDFIKGQQERIAAAQIAEQQRDMLATCAVELASYANESLLKNQPEFLEGLFERVKKYSDAHFGVYGTYEPPKGGQA